MISASYFYAKNITVSCLYKKRKMKNLEKEYCTICKCVSTFHHRHNFILLFDAVNLRLFILGKQNYYYIIALMLVGKSQFVNNIKFKCHLQTYRIIICATAVALTCLKHLRSCVFPFSYGLHWDSVFYVGKYYFFETLCDLNYS